MAQGVALHAKNRPPSAAARWLSCPNSVKVVPLYPNDESDASLKGEVAHTLLENGIIFGVKPNCDDPDININVMDVLEHVRVTREKYGENCQVFAERRYDIPETGEFGTTDVTFVTPRVLHIADYKNGFVEVEILLNAQLMTYLLGAIAEFGERPLYKIEVYQPNYDHKDGPYRVYEVTPENVEWFRNQVKYAMTADEYVAGKHCKKSYCEHRGACRTFLKWAQTNAADAWFPSEVNAMSDEQLSQALDYAEVLQGLRDELRKEAMRRILQMDRQIEGYKVVKSRMDRQFKGKEAIDEAKDILLGLGATDDDIFDKKFVTVAGAERFIKKKFQHMGNGAWKKAWENTLADCVNEYTGGLTLDRASGGRPAHTRGSEFGALTLNTSDPNKANKII